MFRTCSERNKYLFLLFLMFLLLSTNRYLWVGPDIALINQVAGDSFSYLSIARSFPSLDLLAPIPFHHAQRFFIPFVLGGIAFVTNFSPESIFCFVSFAVIFLLIFLVPRISASLFDFDIETQMIVMSLFIFNPYFLREYFAVSFLVNDLTFIIGSLLMIVGLFEISGPKVLLGLTLAAASRQTSILLIPGLILGISFFWWPISKSKALIGGMLAVSVPVLIYLLTAFFAQRFFTGNHNLEHLTGLFCSDLDLKILLEFTARGLISFILPITVVLGVLVTGPAKMDSDSKKKVLCLLTFTLSIWLQPLIAGPDITAGNFQRLGLLGFIPFLLVVGLFLLANLKNGLKQKLFVGILPTAALTSMHHVYSLMGGEPMVLAKKFAIMNLLCATFLFLYIVLARVVHRNEG